jgi:hypothetical protein
LDHPLSRRRTSVSLTDGGRRPLPITQQELTDATGQTSVHENRPLQEMCNAGLINLRSKPLTIADLHRLQGMALYNPNFLHLDANN